MRSHRSGADGVVGSAEVFRNAFFRGDGSMSTTPSAPLKEASRLLLDVASTPPMSGGEWRTRLIHARIQPTYRSSFMCFATASRQEGSFSLDSSFPQPDTRAGGRDLVRV